ncbi:hypothetical protein BHM03_00019799 [Ensete ventricosum]|nr:hypothetical protein BHM03_00019799 [Ensete ventricosum]
MPLIPFLNPFLYPPKVSRVSQMSSASSHLESHSVEVSARRSRALGRPSGDSRSIIVPSSFGDLALDDSRAVEALEMMRSCFNVDSTVTAHRLVDVREHYYVPPEYELHVSSTRGVRDLNETWLAKVSLIPAPQEMFNLGRIKSGGNVSSGSVAPSMANASPTVEVVFMAEKHPSTDEDTKLRKRSKRTASEQLAGATESTTKAHTEKGERADWEGKRAGRG